MRRTRAERRYNTKRKLESFAQKFRKEHGYYSKEEALRIAKAGLNFPHWVWDKERGY